MKRDLHNNITLVQSIVPIVLNNDTEGTGVAVDTKGFEAAEMVFHFGDSGDTLSGALLLQAKLQESDTTTSGDFTDVAAADMLGTLAVIDAPGEDQVVQAVGYVGNKRYIRAFIDTTGTHTNGTPCSAVAILHRDRHIGTTV